MLRSLLLLTLALLVYTAQCDAACDKPTLHFSFDADLTSTGCVQVGSECSGDRVCLISNGPDGGAIEVDGNSLLKVPFMSSFFSQNIVDKFSVSLWARQDAGAFSSAGLVGNSGCTISSTFGITASTSGVSSFVVTGETTRQKISASTNVQISSGWTHLAFTYDGNTLSIYVDGDEKAQTTRSGLHQPIASNSCPMTIGQAGADSSDVHFFKGGLANVAVFDRVLTVDEVQAMKQKTFDYQST